MKQVACLTLALVGSALLLWASSASAHTRSMSYSLWDLSDDGAMVRLRISRLELTRLALDPVASPSDDQVVRRMVADRVRLAVEGELCPPVDTVERVAASEGYVAYRWRVECPRTGPRTVESRLMLDAAPSHLHFARVRKPGQSAVEKVLTEVAPVWALDAPSGDGSDAAAGTSVVQYLKLGIEHILTGWDHLAFVAGLLLLAYTLRDIATLVSSFTIAHSITLALAVLGLVEPEGHVVEALIGYSIALVGIENGWLSAGKGLVAPLLLVSALMVMTVSGSSLPVQALVGMALFTACHFALLQRWSRPQVLRAAVAFAFGLIHGFGFAGIMMELDLENVRLAPALFGFNAGVEVGQLAVVALLWPLLVGLRRSARASRLVVDMGSAAVTALGLFWFLTRSF